MILGAAGEVCAIVDLAMVIAPVCVKKVDEVDGKVKRATAKGSD